MEWWSACPGGGCYIPIGTGVLGVCWRDGYGAWHYVQTACGWNDSWDRLRINAGDGDDEVIAHPSGASRFACEGGYFAIDPAAWGSSQFNVGLDVYLGEGIDAFDGTPMSDVVRSNDFGLNDDGSGAGPRNPYLGDVMCGYGGNDGLYGDADNATGWANNECLNGGSGTDVCNGATSTTPTDYDDNWACETNSNNYSSGTTGYTSACQNACTSPDLSPAAHRCPTYCCPTYCTAP